MEMTMLDLDALERIEKAVALREEGARQDARRRAIQSSKSLAELFAEQMEYATVHNLRCADLRALLTALKDAQARASAPDHGEVERLRAGRDAMEWRPTHRHVKRGTDYQVIGTASLQAGEPVGEAASLVVYRDENGRLWVRPEVEFDDGRFAAHSPASPEGEG